MANMQVPVEETVATPAQEGLAASKMPNQSMDDMKTEVVSGLLDGSVTPQQAIQSRIMTPAEVQSVMEAVQKASMSNGPQDSGLAARGMVR